VDAITGFTRYTGSVRAGTTRLDGLSPDRRRRRGLARTWQAGELFNELTVAENVRVPLQPIGLRSVMRDLFGRASAADADDVRQILEIVGLGEHGDRKPQELSLGQQKLVGVARAMAGRPGVLLLDEPAAGLDSAESALFGTRVRTIAQGGTAVLLIDHDMSLVLEVCDVVYVLDFGNLIAHGPPAEVRADERVLKAYLGVDINDAAGGAEDYVP
jgi:ABC-type branched-subunit amino acid transport system ATPase component